MDSVWIADPGPGSRQDPLAVAAAVGRLAPRIDLRVRVTVSRHRPPVVLAKALTTLDILTGGRVVGVLGCGSAPSRPDLKLLSENLEVIRGLGGGGPLSYDGDLVNVNGARNRPIPLSTPLPLWVEGPGEAAVFDVVASTAHGWFSPAAGSPRDHVALRGDLERHWVRAGRSPGAVVISALAGLDGDPEVAATQLRRWARLGVSELVVEGLGGPSQGGGDDLAKLAEAGKLSGVWQTSAPPS